MINNDSNKGENPTLSISIQVKVSN